MGHCLLLRRRPWGAPLPASPTASPAPGGTCSRCPLASTLRYTARGGPEFFSPPHPPTFLHRRWRMPPRMRGSERSADPAPLPTDRGLVVTVHSGTPADCNLQSG